MHLHHRESRHPAALFLLLFALVTAPPAFGAATLELREVGGDVVLTGSGNLDLSAWTLFATNSAQGGGLRANGFILTGAPGDLINVFESPVNFSGPTSIGPGTTFFPASSGSGHAFGMRFDVPRLGYRLSTTSQVPLNGTSTWTGQTLGSLGVTPGAYVWTWGSGGTADSLTLLAYGGACVDLDGDGYGAFGHVDCPGGLDADCDDADPLIHPSAADVCDGIDNNCSGGIDEGGATCGQSLVDGTMLQLDVWIDGFSLLSGPIPLQLGAPEVVATPIIGNIALDLDVENESIQFTLSNGSGGVGNVQFVARLSAMQWTDPDTQIVGASATTDFDYVWATQPPPFPPPGLASIVDNGHGVEIYVEELLFQSNEAHSASVSFAAAQVVQPVPVPVLSAPATIVLSALVGGGGVGFARRKTVGPRRGARDHLGNGSEPRTAPARHGSQ